MDKFEIAFWTIHVIGMILCLANAVRLGIAGRDYSDWVVLAPIWTMVIAICLTGFVLTSPMWILYGIVTLIVKVYKK